MVEPAALVAPLARKHWATQEICQAAQLPRRPWQASREHAGHNIGIGLAALADWAPHDGLPDAESCCSYGYFANDGWLTPFLPALYYPQRRVGPLQHYGATRQSAITPCQWQCGTRWQSQGILGRL